MSLTLANEARNRPLASRDLPRNSSNTMGSVHGKLFVWVFLLLIYAFAHSVLCFRLHLSHFST
jgi:hypothetical protein